jgi:hypothetical protein
MFHQLLKLQHSTSQQVRIGGPNNFTNNSRINITHVPSASGGSVHSPGKEDQYILLGIEGSTETETVHFNNMDLYFSRQVLKGHHISHVLYPCICIGK